MYFPSFKKVEKMWETFKRDVKSTNFSCMKINVKTKELLVKKGNVAKEHNHTCSLKCYRASVIPHTIYTWWGYQFECFAT